MPAIQAVIFDLDDTLYPEREYAFSGFDAVVAKFKDVFGSTECAAARMRELFETGDRPRVFDVLLAERGIAPTPQLIQTMVATYRTHTPRIRLFPDAEAALTRLQNNYKLGLITDGPSVMQWAKIDALRLRERIDAIIVTDDLEPTSITPLPPKERGRSEGFRDRCVGGGFAKPHPLAYERMVERLCVLHTESVYVADNVGKDFLAPRTLGWRTIQLNRPGAIYRDSLAPRGGEPDQTVASLDDIERLLA